MTDRHTIITSAFGYNVNNMTFSTPQVGSINTPDGKPGITFQRINIGTINEDGSQGDLIFETEQCFSFGISPNTDVSSGKLNGYVFPLCLYSKNGVTDREKEWVETINRVVEKCKDHVINNKEEIKQYDLERNDLKKFNPIYWKRDKGKIVDGTGPTLYAKLLHSKKTNKIMTLFYNDSDEQIDPLSLEKKYCFAKGTIKIESIFIGTKISLQIKLYECAVKLLKTGVQRLLPPRPLASSTVSVSVDSQNPMSSSSKSDDKNLDEDDDVASIDLDDAPVNNTPPPAPVKKILRKVVRK